MSTLEQGLLLPYQRRWVADASPLKVCEKGRRTGITWAEASDDVLIAATDRRHGGQNVYYFPQARDDAIEYVEACAKWARAFGHAAAQVDEWGGTWEEELGTVLPDDDPDKHIQTYKISFASGHRIVALSSAPSRARGKQGVFVIDEAAFHPNLPGVVKAVMATLLRRGRVRVISTHNGEDNPFNDLVTEIRAGRRKGTVHHYPFRLAVREGMFRRICELEGEAWTAEREAAYIADAYGFYGDDAAEELDAVPSAGGGTYLSSAMVEARMRPAPVLRLAYDETFAHRPDGERWSECQDWIQDLLDPLLAALDPREEHVYGMDFGRTGHLSVIAPMAIGQTLRRRVPFLVELRNVPYKQQIQILFHVVRALPRFRKGANDARGNGQAVAEWAWQEFGASRIDAVMLSTEWYREHTPAFKAAFEDDEIEIPKDADVLRDLRAIRMDKGVAKVPDKYEGTGADGKPRHADSAVALLLAHYASRQDPSPIEFESAGRRSSVAALGGLGIAEQVGFGVVSGANDFEGYL